MSDAKKPTTTKPKDERLMLTVLIDGPAGVLKAQIPHASQEEGHKLLAAALVEYYEGMAAQGHQVPRLRPVRSGIVVPKAGTVSVMRN